MIDLETLSTSPNAVILTLGAVKFNRTPVNSNSGAPTLDSLNSFYRRIEIESCIAKGLVVSPDTEEWWRSQNSEARHEAMEHKDRIPLVQALKEFSTWFLGSKNVWSHGATFDCVILEHAYRACGLDVPWMFWDARDTRTLYDVSGVVLKDFAVKVQHHALYDAYRQVLAALESLRRLQSKN